MASIQSVQKRVANRAAKVWALERALRNGSPHQPAPPTIVLNRSVQTVQLAVRNKGVDHGLSGVHRFLHNELPKLKYNNPHVNVELRPASEGATMTVDGKHQFDIHDATPDDILAVLRRFEHTSSS